MTEVVIVLDLKDLPRRVFGPGANGVSLNAFATNHDRLAFIASHDDVKQRGDDFGRKHELVRRWREDEVCRAGNGENKSAILAYFIQRSIEDRGRAVLTTNRDDALCR